VLPRVSSRFTVVEKSSGRFCQENEPATAYALHVTEGRLSSLWETFAVSHLLTRDQDLKEMIGKISKGEKSNASHRTIFEEVLESDLPPEQKMPERLGHEAQTVIGAGLVTTAWELNRAIPNPRTPVDWVKLEELPFLTGCVKESIRLSYGVTSRLPRISRDGPMKYKDWKIPTGTPVGMTIVDVHHDENVFPESQKFIPERWMNGARAPNGEPLERYLVAFGKGPRQCLGIKYVPSVVHVSCPQTPTDEFLSLAHAELYMGIASLFRRFNLELYETDKSDLVLKHDFFLPAPKSESKGVRVVVKSINH
jgi:hypothetical protein